MLRGIYPDGKGLRVKKLFVAADIEGCAAVSNQHELGSQGWGWAKARDWMTNEVAAACEAGLEAGYDEIIVADGHGNAQNIHPDGLPARVRLVRSWPRPLLQMQGVEDPDVDACVFIGNHASSQTPGAILAHTYYSSAIRDLRLNGQSASEGYFNAALAGFFGKPVVFVSGDQHTIEDAKRYAPDAELCAVKQSIGWRAQSSLSPAESCRKIRAGVASGLARAGKARAFVVNGPFVVELEMSTQIASEVFDYLPMIERVNAYTVRARFDTMVDAMKFVSFTIFFSPVGVIAL